MINILKIDTNRVEVEETYDLVKGLQEVLDEKDSIIVLPYGIDLLLDVPIEEVISVRDSLNRIIESRSQHDDL